MSARSKSGGFRILAVNPGSTSTRLALFEDETPLFSESTAHSAEDLRAFSRIADQYEFRVRAVNGFLSGNGIPVDSLDAVVGRGGLLRPIEGGTYAVSDRMRQDLMEAARGEHASNLGGLIARALADSARIPAFIVDPVVVDELEDVSRVSGLPLIQRRSIFHALNQKAVARIAAEKLGKTVDEINLVVAHLGGGISVGSHRRGRVVDVNNALDGDGPFSPERAGGLPSGQLADLCFSGKLTLAEARKMITGGGGWVAHLGTNDLREVRRRVETGDANAERVLNATIHQIVKQVGLAAAVLDGDVQAVVLTGGMAADAGFAGRISARVAWIARVIVIPGEQEMTALCMGTLRVLRGQETAKQY
jgi:butyrate kinase